MSIFSELVGEYFIQQKISFLNELSLACAAVKRRQVIKSKWNGKLVELLSASFYSATLSKFKYPVRPTHWPSFVTQYEEFNWIRESHVLPSAWISISFLLGFCFSAFLSLALMCTSCGKCSCSPLMLHLLICKEHFSLDSIFSQFPSCMSSVAKFFLNEYFVYSVYTITRLSELQCSIGKVFVCDFFQYQNH